jgi:DNA end-binding protein Ku
MVQTLLWADEVREPAFPALDDDVRITATELELSAALVESFSADFSPEEFRDDYQEELRTLIRAKLSQGEALDTDATFGKGDEGEGAEIIDLMEALRQSVSKSRASKGRGSSSSRSTSSGSGAATSASARKSSATRKQPTEKTKDAKKPARPRKSA